MKRLIAALPVVLIAVFSLSSSAGTQPAKVARIGMLCYVACSGGPTYDALYDELRKLGWLEGTTIVIERKEAGRSVERLADLAAELVRSKPDLILAVSPQPARAAKNATSDIPI